MFSFTLVALALMSAALAAGDLVTISQRKPYLDSLQNKPLIDSSNLSLGSKKITSQPEVVKRLTQMAISISKRGYKGISQSEGILRGYLNYSLRGGRSVVDQEASGVLCRRFESYPPYLSRGTRMVYRLVFGQVVVQLILGFGSRGGSKPPLYTKIVA